MTTNKQDALRRDAFERMRQAITDLDVANAPGLHLSEDRARLLQELQASVQLAAELLVVLDHHVRGPLTVVKGRAQMLRRQQLAAPQPDLRLIAGLNEIDDAVDRVVAQLNRLLGSRFGPSDDTSTIDREPS